MRKRLMLSTLSMAAISLAVMGCNQKQNSQQNAQVVTAAEQAQAAAHSDQPQQAPNVAPAMQQAASSIPEFTFYQVKSGIAYTKADIPTGKNTVFLLFDPGCSHCQQETMALSARYNEIKDVNLVYVSMNDPALLNQFFSTFGKELNGKENVTMLWDRNQEFVQKFHIPSIFPANYVYGPDGQLKTYWEGDKPINDIIAAFTK